MFIYGKDFVWMQKFSPIYMYSRYMRKIITPRKVENINLKECAKNVKNQLHAYHNDTLDENVNLQKEMRMDEEIRLHTCTKSVPYIMNCLKDN